jgi:hypothetical protein
MSQAEHVTNGFMIATYILAPLFGLSIVILIAGSVYAVKLRKQLSEWESDVKSGSGNPSTEEGSQSTKNLQKAQV